MRKCNDCGGTWFSQADWCIHCNSKNIVFDYEEDAISGETAQ